MSVRARGRGVQAEPSFIRVVRRVEIRSVIIFVKMMLPQLLCHKGSGAAAASR